MLKRVLMNAVAGALLCSAPYVLAADDYPSKSIKVIVPFAAGSSSDILGRIVTEKMSAVLGQSFIIENKAGAGGTIGVAHVADAPADGYTLLLTTSSPITINPLIDSAVRYDVQKDLTPIAVLNSIGLLLVSNPDFPASNLKDLVKEVKQHPDKYSFATNGNGSYSHMSMELLKHKLGLEMTHIPYKGASQAEVDVIGGRVALMFDSVVTGSELVKAGRLKSFGISSRLADPLATEQLPLAEQDIEELQDFDVTAFTGLLAPSGTPEGVRKKLRDAALAVLQDDDLRQALSDRKIPFAMPEAIDSMPELLQGENEKWSELVKIANIRIN